MALTGNKDDITLAHHCDCRMDGFRPVTNLAGAGRRDENFAADRCRDFAAWVIVSDDDYVRVLDSDLAHNRPLALVAVATAAEDADQLAGDKRPASDKRC